MDPYLFLVATLMLATATRGADDIYALEPQVQNLANQLTALQARLQAAETEIQTMKGKKQIAFSLARTDKLVSCMHSYL